jgi:hypothetical protein
MKNRYISIATMIAMSLFSLAVFANAYNAQDLVGMKAKNADPQLQSRGYTRVGSDRSDKNHSWGMWWNPSSRQCLTVAYARGKVENITDSPEYDCNQSSGSGDDAKIQAYIERWGRECKSAAAQNYDASMSEVRVSVGATEQQSIDAGDLTWNDIQRYGLSFSWEVNQRNGKADGYCNVDGRGQLVDFVANNEDFRSSNSSGSGDDAKIQARIGSWGTNCKNKVAEQFDVAMSDIQVSVGASEQQSIDAGDTTLSDIQRYGLSFNWEVKSQYKSGSGYCNTDGDGNVVEFRQ